MLGDPVLGIDTLRRDFKARWSSWILFLKVYLIIPLGKIHMQEILRLPNFLFTELAEGKLSHFVHFGLKLVVGRPSWASLHPVLNPKSNQLEPQGVKICFCPGRNRSSGLLQFLFVEIFFGNIVHHLFYFGHVGSAEIAFVKFQWAVDELILEPRLSPQI